MNTFSIEGMKMKIIPISHKTLSAQCTISSSQFDCSVERRPAITLSLPSTVMGFSSFLGRVLFASLFILSAWQTFNEFGTDGGPAAKELSPKLAIVKKFLTSKLGEEAQKIDVSHFVAASIVLKGLGGALFVFGSSLGAYLLLYYLAFTTPLLYDFYNYESGEPEFALLQEFLQCIALFGALLYFLGMKNSITRQQLKRKTQKTKTG